MPSHRCLPSPRTLSALLLLILQIRLRFSFLQESPACSPQVRIKPLWYVTQQEVLQYLLLSPEKPFLPEGQWPRLSVREGLTHCRHVINVVGWMCIYLALWKQKDEFFLWAQGQVAGMKNSKQIYTDSYMPSTDLSALHVLTYLILTVTLQVGTNIICVLHIRKLRHRVSCLSSHS